MKVPLHSLPWLVQIQPIQMLIQGNENAWRDHTSTQVVQSFPLSLSYLMLMVLSIPQHSVTALPRSASVLLQSVIARQHSRSVSIHPQSLRAPPGSFSVQPHYQCPPVLLLSLLLLLTSQVVLYLSQAVLYLSPAVPDLNPSVPVSAHSLFVNFHS